MTRSPRLRRLGGALAATLGALAFMAGGVSQARAGGPEFAHAWIYSGGVMRDLGTLPGTDSSSAWGVNGLGQVVGESGGHAFLWTAQAGMVDLNSMLPANSGWTLVAASGINDAGQVTGFGVSAGGTFRSYILTLPTGGGSASIIDIGTMPGGANAQAAAINAAGQVVGQGDTTSPYVPSQNLPRAFLYSSGTMSSLGSFANAPMSGATDINDLGAVAGWSDLAAAPNFFVEHHAFVFTNGVLVDLGTGGASGINNAGDVVGVTGQDPDPGHAALFRAGTVTDLGVLAGDTSSYANGINSAGTIVGSSRNDLGSEHAVIFGSSGPSAVGTLPGYENSVATRVNSAGLIIGFSYTTMNTPLGNPTVQPFDPATGNTPATLSFTGVTQTGDTSLTTSSTGPPAPSGFTLGTPPTYYDLSTTAVYGQVVVCFSDPSITAASRLLHWSGGVATDVTAAGFPDVANLRICSVPLTSLSPFAIATGSAKDTSFPVTTAGATPAANAAGWNRDNVTVALSANDADGVADVASIHYSATGAQPISPAAVAGAAASVVIGAEGLTTLSFYAEDRAGNSETPRSIPIRIDRSAPTVTYTGNAVTYTVDQPVSISCLAADPDFANRTHGSGLVASTNTCHDVTGPAYTFGAGSHTYSASVQDVAGNAGTGSTTFTVQVTFGSLCTLTKRFVQTSPKFASLPLAEQRLWNQFADDLCLRLASAAVALKPEDRARLIAGYQAALPVLVRNGLLTAAQGATLLTLSRAL